MNYAFISLEAFEAWHQKVKEGLGIPYPNRNSKTGKPDENATWTTEYTKLYKDDNGISFAKVEDKIAEKFSEGLGEPFEPHFEPKEII